ADLDKRIRAYMATLPIAMSGQGGHDATFRAALVLIQGWGLSLDEARPYMEAYNVLCQPPWSAKELEHKLSDAIKAPLHRPYGFLRFKDDRKTAKDDSRVRECVSAENAENAEISPPTVEIKWETSANSAISGGPHTQKAIYPKDSIYEDFYALALTVTEGA